MPSAKTVILTACGVLFVCGGGGGAELFVVQSPYQKRLELLSTVIRDDHAWKYVFAQSVYHELDRRHYGRIVDEELLTGALDPAGQTNAAGADPIKPLVFLKNVFVKRYRIGSLLETGQAVLQKSFRCLAYKHFAHLLKLVRVEISRKSSQRKAVSWSAKAKAAVADVVMKMAALQFTDGLLLRAARFFDVYDKHDAKNVKSKFNYTPTLDELTGGMRAYIGQHCVKSPKTERDIAVELKVMFNDHLYDAAHSKTLPNNVFKKMFASSMGKINEHFGGLPRHEGMSANRWNEFLRFKQKGEHTQEEEEEEEAFLQIDL